MGQFVCGILNTYNQLNDFEKTQSFKLLQNISKLESELQGYKHINLTPEQIVEIDRAYREKCEELEELQKKMPRCNLEDTVWVVSKPDKQIKSGKVFQICYENDIFTYYSDVYGFSNADINVDVFLTENEAEQALKRLESET